MAEHHHGLGRHKQLHSIMENSTLLLTRRGRLHSVATTLLLLGFLAALNASRNTLLLPKQLSSPSSLTPHNKSRSMSISIEDHDGDGRGLTNVSSETEVSSNNETRLMTPGCLRKDCIRSQASRLARAFPDRIDRLKWCLEVHDHDDHQNPNRERAKNTEAVQGLVLIKVPKAASSTSAAVVLRIAQRYGCQQLHYVHKHASDYYRKGLFLPQNSFLFAPVRDPASRAISRLWFTHGSQIRKKKSNGRRRAAAEFMINELETSTSNQFGTISEGQGGFQLRYLSSEKIHPWSAWNPHDDDNNTMTAADIVKNPLQVIEHVRRIVNAYNFLLVTERLDESLVALALVMGLDMTDILVPNSKVQSKNTTTYTYEKNENQCRPLLKGKTPVAVQDYFQSRTWRAANYGDYLLHEAANHSLDLTIARLGRGRFDAAVAEYQRLQKMASEACAQDFVHSLPCSPEGVVQLNMSEPNCYLPGKDYGCGYKCIDEMLLKTESQGLHSILQ